MYKLALFIAVSFYSSIMLSGEGGAAAPVQQNRLQQYTEQQQIKLKELNEQLKKLTSKKDYEHVKTLVTQAIVQHNLNPDDIKYDSSPIAAKAASQNDLAFVDFLLTHGASPNIPCFNLFSLRMPDYSAEVFELLLRHGADVYKKLGGRTAFEELINNGPFNYVMNQDTAIESNLDDFYKKVRLSILYGSPIPENLQSLIYNNAIRYKNLPPETYVNIAWVFTQLTRVICDAIEERETLVKQYTQKTQETTSQLHILTTLPKEIAGIIASYTTTILAFINHYLQSQQQKKSV